MVGVNTLVQKRVHLIYILYQRVKEIFTRHYLSRLRLIACLPPAAVRRASDWSDLCSISYLFQFEIAIFLLHVKLRFDVGLISIWVFYENEVLDNYVDAFSFFLDLFINASSALGSFLFSVVFRFHLLVFTCSKDFNQVVKLLGSLEAVNNDETIA